MNLIEINNKFPTELDAVKYLEKLRWGKKVRCSYCNSENVGKRNIDNRFHCKSCSKSFSVTTGTKLHRTRIPLKTWYIAIAVICDAKKGISAKQLERNIGVHYETAWTMYMKIRDLMHDPKKELDDIVEMDETYIGGKPRKGADSKCLPRKKQKELDGKIKELKEDGFTFKKGTRKVACDKDVKRGRGTKKIPVVGIVERNGDVVAEVMRSLTKSNLESMIKKHVDTKESVIVTDSYKGYSRLHNIIEHVKIDHQKMYSYRGVNTNTIESFWAIIERGVMGQYHKVSPKYLPKYVSEFVFKFNNRNKDDMLETILKNAVNH